MLSAGVHTGTRNSDSQMVDYIWRRRNDGVHIINIGKTWEKLMLAARVIVAIENPSDVIAISARPYGMRATLKYGEFYINVLARSLISSAPLASCETLSHSTVPSEFLEMQPFTLDRDPSLVASPLVLSQIKSPNSSANHAY